MKKKARLSKTPKRRKVEVKVDEEPVGFLSRFHTLPLDIVFEVRDPSSALFDADRPRRSFRCWSPSTCSRSGGSTSGGGACSSAARRSPSGTGPLPIFPATFRRAPTISTLPSWPGSSSTTRAWCVHLLHPYFRGPTTRQLCDSPTTFLWYPLRLRLCAKCTNKTIFNPDKHRPITYNLDQNIFRLNLLPCRQVGAERHLYLPDVRWLDAELRAAKEEGEERYRAVVQAYKQMAKSHEEVRTTPSRDQAPVLKMRQQEDDIDAWRGRLFWWEDSQYKQWREQRRRLLVVCRIPF